MGLNYIGPQEKLIKSENLKLYCDIFNISLVADMQTLDK